eukprot:165373_1
MRKQYASSLHFRRQTQATEINNTLYPMVKSSMKSFDYKSPPNSYIDLVLQKKKKLSLMGKTPEYLDELNILDWASKMIVGDDVLVEHSSQSDGGFLYDKSKKKNN